MNEADLEKLKKAYEKVADSIIELIRTGLIEKGTSEDFYIRHSYDKYKAKHELLKMLTKEKTEKT